MNSNTMLTCECSNDVSRRHAPLHNPSCKHHSVCLRLRLALAAGPLCCCIWLAPLFLTFSQSSYDGLLNKELDLKLLKLFRICCQRVVQAGPCLGFTPSWLASSWGNSLPSAWLQGLPAGVVHIPTLFPKGPVICFYFPAARIPDLKQPQMCDDIVGERESSLRTYF